MNTHELREAQARYENQKDEILKDRKELYHLRDSFAKYFNRSRISKMQIDNYVLGVDLPTNGYNFCYTLERKLDGLGRMIGATAYKFGVYHGKTSLDRKNKYRFAKKFGNNYQNAFEGVRKAILQLLVAGENEKIDIIAENILSPMFKGKILCTYYPDRYLNVFSEDHLDYFLTQLDLDTEELIRSNHVYKREALLKFKNQDSIMKKWSIDLFSNFLYTEYPGRPPQKVQDQDVSAHKLESYKIPKYPANPLSSFIELNILPPVQNNKNKKAERDLRHPKPDYFIEARRLKILGDRGEKIVMDLEKKKLCNIGRKDLAQKVNRVSLISDSYGYDILSYDTDGREKFIEVKATGSKAGTANFFCSVNELYEARKLKNYFIYIVYEVTTKYPKVWVIKNPFHPPHKSIIMTPVNYRITINAKKN